MHVELIAWVLPLYLSDGVWAVAGSQGCLLIVLVQCLQESREWNDVLDCEGNPSQLTIAVPQTTCTLEIRYLTVEIHNLVKRVELTIVHEGL